MPLTYNLPSEYPIFVEEFKRTKDREKALWIMKPVSYFPKNRSVVVKARESSCSRTSVKSATGLTCPTSPKHISFKDTFTTRYWLATRSSIWEFMFWWPLTTLSPFTCIVLDLPGLHTTDMTPMTLETLLHIWRMWPFKRSLKTMMKKGVGSICLTSSDSTWYRSSGNSGPKNASSKCNNLSSGL